MDENIPLIVGLTSGLGSLILGLVLITVWLVISNNRGGRIRLQDTPYAGSYDDEEQFLRDEANALEQMSEMERRTYESAKAFIQSNPPDSVDSEISLGQYMTIQEKGVAAWEFQMDFFANINNAALSNAANSSYVTCFVESRTELHFLGGNLAPEMSSPKSVQTNLPLPKQNETYYWEIKMYDKPKDTIVAVGVCTKPYPLMQLPGQHRYSVSYQSTGHKRINQPFKNIPSFGHPFNQGDVVGVGYRPRTGTIFFTRNGKRLGEVVHGMRFNVFPTIGATGPCQLHVNFGQLGFVLIEANVQKWGLAPTQGTLPPPPPYGHHQQNSLLLESDHDNNTVDSPPPFENILTAASSINIGLDASDSINLNKLPHIRHSELTDFIESPNFCENLREAQTEMLDPPKRSLNTSPPPLYHNR